MPDFRNAGSRQDTAADGEFYYILANCYYELGQYAESVTAYQKAIRRDDTNARYYRGWQWPRPRPATRARPLPR
ncbi:MAG: tetratricopeptide repeat protein [Gemmiger formicilis]|uniref:tetratricopeptide repeat protein n=1 Tax=Gemmiger formicilis TaxID=745368 RepID=UPI003992E94F